MQLSFSADTFSTPAPEVAALVEQVVAPVEEVAVAPAEIVTPVEEVAAQVEEVTMAVAAVLEEFAAPAEAEKPKGIKLPTTELTDDWMDDDMGSINSEESDEEDDVAKEAPAVVEKTSSDIEPEKETISQEIFSLTEVSTVKEEKVKEVSAEDILAVKETQEDSLAPAEA